MTTWQEGIDAAEFEFIEGLERRGFRCDGRTLTGEVHDGTKEVRITITLSDRFPFAPPAVSPPAETPRSWHRERNGDMCLYSADGRDGLPWLDVEDFLSLVERWLVESVGGWKGDFPDLDLERYFPDAGEALVVFGDLAGLGNSYVSLRRHANFTAITGPGSVPRNKRVGKDRAYGYVIDIGEPAYPPTSWDDLEKLIQNDQARVIRSGVCEQRISYLVVKYHRGGVDAVVVLRTRVEKGRTITVSAVESASESDVVLRLRAGKNSSGLDSVRVAVVGVGAIGSFVCDLLSRAGVGFVSAYDPDVVRPGNLVRHLAESESVGLPKTTAIKQLIESRRYTITSVSDYPDKIPSPRDVMYLFRDHDLVIDASASGDASHMLATAAHAGGHRMLSVCIQEDGEVVRVDVIPPSCGDALPRTELSPPPSRDDLRFESGCGDPVSLTPAFAVYEAASLAVRYAVRMLQNQPISDAGVVRDYR